MDVEVVVLAVGVFQLKAVVAFACCCPLLVAFLGLFGKRENFWEGEGGGLLRPPGGFLCRLLPYAAQSCPPSSMNLETNLEGIIRVTWKSFSRRRIKVVSLVQKALEWVFSSRWEAKLGVIHFAFWWLRIGPWPH